MTTASVPGFRGTLYLATSSSGTGNPSSSGGSLVKFGELQEVTLNLAEGAMEATSKDSGAWREFLPGLREWGLSGSGLYLLETSDPGQLGIYNVLAGNVPVWVSLREAASSAQTPPIQEYQGTGIVTAFDLESPLDKPAGAKLAIKGTGVLTKQAATS